MERRNFIIGSAAVGIMLPLSGFAKFFAGDLEILDPILVGNYLKVWPFRFRSTGYTGHIHSYLPVIASSPQLKWSIWFDYVYESHYKTRIANGGPGVPNGYIWEDSHGFPRFYTYKTDRDTLLKDLDSLHRKIISTNPKWKLPAASTGRHDYGWNVVELASNEGLKLCS